MYNMDRRREHPGEGGTESRDAALCQDRPYRGLYERTGGLPESATQHNCRRQVAIYVSSYCSSTTTIYVSSYVYTSTEHLHMAPAVLLLKRYYTCVLVLVYVDRAPECGPCCMCAGRCCYICVLLLRYTFPRTSLHTCIRQQHLNGGPCCVRVLVHVVRIL